ncbi:MAG: hypothetical protein SAL70_31120 [Scytonema sp. PMC 1070.18]|nr:hypothetical protein [Scytonema sp. PMC 1070.18]
MNLPAVLDVILGLIFIYLILSLLASEIQELIATVLQWRAEHLKKSIEILLSGNQRRTRNGNKVDDGLLLANQLYENPLIKNINQEAKGWLATIPRQVTWKIGRLYRSLLPRSEEERNQTTFGNTKHTGPSYIPADIFATTLLETLQIPKMVQWLTEVRMERYKNDRLQEIQAIINQYQGEALDDNQVQIVEKAKSYFQKVEKDYNTIIDNFKKKKIGLDSSIERMGESLQRYIDNLSEGENKEQPKNHLIQELMYLKQDSFENIEQAILLGGLHPNIDEVVNLIRYGSATYKEIEGIVKRTDIQNNENLEEFIKRIPEPVKENIAVMAMRTQSRIRSTKEGLDNLRNEIERAYDSSMARASGVYKRNAKGVALLIGFVLAIAANADTFHMINRLSKDSALREIITENAGQIVLRRAGTPTNQQLQNQPVTEENILLDDLKREVNNALADIDLPIGWSQTNWRQQIGAIPDTQTTLPGEAPATPTRPRNFPTALLKIIAGWILSGIAIAMGAPFWFDLLSKVMNVRNAGKRPES